MSARRPRAAAESARSRSCSVIHFRPGITPGGIAAATGFRRIRGRSHAQAPRRTTASSLALPAPFDGRTSNVRLTRKGRVRVARFDEAIADYPGDGTCHRWPPLLAAIGGEGHAQAGPTGGLDVASPCRGWARHSFSRSTTLRSSASMTSPDAAALTLIRARGARATHRTGRASCGLSSSGTSDLLDRLEAAGLVDRRHDEPDDRRAVHGPSDHATGSTRPTSDGPSSPATSSPSPPP